MKCDKDCLNCKLPVCRHDMSSAEANREHCREYYQKHKEEIKKKHRERYAKNREVLKSKALARYYANKEEINRKTKERRMSREV